MTAKKRPPESADRDEESASMDSALPMERFKSLARKLVKVSKDDVRQTQRAQRTSKKKC